MLSISDPGEHLVRENFPTQGWNFIFNFSNYTKWDKHYTVFISNEVIAQKCVSNDGGSRGNRSLLYLDKRSFPKYSPLGIITCVMVRFVS